MTIDKVRRMQIITRWHRRFAVFVSLWLMVLASSGIAVNHAHGLGLDRSPLPTALQSVFYGIAAKDEDFCDMVTTIGQDCTGIFASLPLDMGTLLLDDSSLYMLDDQGRLLEKLGASHFGLARIEAGLSHDSFIYLQDQRKTVRVDAELLDWDVLQAQAVDALADRHWQTLGGAKSISWERLMLDIHAARFLGPLAEWFNDLMAVFILFLALSGIRLHRLKRNGSGNGNNV